MAENVENNRNIIRGPKPEFKEYTKGLGEFYFENFDKFSQNVFQIEAETGIKETYATVKEKSVKLAINLAKIGVNSENLILICSKNTLNNCIPHFSALLLGAKTAALHHTQTPREWTHCIKMCQPSFIFVEENCVQNMEKSIENLEVKPELIVFGKSVKYKTFDDLQKPSEDESKFRPFEVKNCHETAVILFSSGTTGPAKGMCISHYSIINRAVSSVGQGPFALTAIGLTYSTLYWISSVLQLTLCFQSGGAKIIPPPEYNPTEMFEMIEKYKVFFIFINPVLLRAIFSLENTEKYDTSSLKFISTIGTILHKHELTKLRKIFKNTFVSQAYGTSETITCGIGFTPFTDKRLLEKLESVGKVSPYCDIKIIDPNTGEILGPKKPGEIYIKSLFHFIEYCNNDSTACFDKDGFFKTGDLGYYDEDECFYIVGRIKETFKYRNYHVPLDYLESILQEHPDVLQAGIFGIPDEKDGHLPAACVVLKPNSLSTVDDIEEFYVKNVSDWHKLRGGIKVVDALPVTPTFKLQRNKLLDLFIEK